MRTHYQTYMGQTCTPTSNPDVCFHTRNDTGTTDEKTTVSRVDVKLGEKQTVAARFNYNDQKFVRPNYGPLDWTQFPQKFKNLGVQHNYALSPNKFNEVRVGYNATKLNRLQGVPALREVAWYDAPGLSSISVADQLQPDTHTYSVVDNFSWIRGRHTLKMGAEVRKIQTTRIQQEPPNLTYNSLQDLFDNKPDNVGVLFGNANLGFNSQNVGVYVQDDFRINKRVQLNIGLRYEYYSGFRGPNNVVSDPFGPFAPPAKPGPDNAPIFKINKLNLGPRLGLVIDLTGRGKTVLRAGGGILYIPPQPFYYFDMAFLPEGVPFYQIFRAVDLPPSVILTFPFTTTWGPSVVAAALKGDLSVLPPGLKLGRSIAERDRKDEHAGQWNLSLQHALTNSLAIQGSYVGSRALSQVGWRDVNLVNPQTGQRVNPAFGAVGVRTSEAASSYHAFQLSVNQRLSKGFTADGYYTLARARLYGDADANYGTTNGTVQDYNNLAGSAGPKQSDSRHRAVLVPGYQFPTPGFAKQSGLGRGILGDWKLQMIVNARSGFPLDVTMGRDVVGNGRATAQRPDVVPGVNPKVEGPDRLLWFTRAAFDVAGPTAGKRFGTLGYNTLRGPGAFWTDLSLLKTFTIKEEHQIQFRLEMFNWLNHVVLGNPITNLANANFGRVTSGGNGRNMQVALRYSF